MAVILTIASPKGGVGKTTIALNLSFSLARRGWRVLLVDSDPQGGIANGIVKSGAHRKGLADIVKGNEWVPEAILKTRIPEFQLLLSGKIPAHESGAFWARLFHNQVFGLVHAKVKNRFDLVVIDTPPGFGKGTLAALRGSQFVISPLQAEPSAVRTLPQFLEVVSWLRSKGVGLEIAGLVLTMVQFRNRESLEVARSVWAELPEDLVLKTVIPRDPAFLKASAIGAPLGLLRPRSPVTTVFDQLAVELEPRLNLQKELSDESLSLFT